MKRLTERQFWKLYAEIRSKAEAVELHLYTRRNWIKSYKQETRDRWDFYSVITFTRIREFQDKEKKINEILSAHGLQL